MIQIFSPAKINLTLDVRPKEPDASFHELETIYHKLNWGDALTLEKAETFHLLGDFNCLPENNLIYKAWQCLANPRPVKITVNKIIPSGAGLGGGSSNAASFIQAYYQLFELGAVPSELISQLGELGKDIPFFMQAAPCALGTGFGEVIEPLNFNLSGTDLYLYFPDFKQPTNQAYSHLQKFNQVQSQKLIQSRDLKDCGNTFNQLFEQNNYSKIINSQHKDKINLCGSGSTFYSFEVLDIPECKMVKVTLL